jgi:hypothetical protein
MMIARAKVRRISAGACMMSESRHTVFKSVQTLIDVITDFVKKHNENPKIFTWTEVEHDFLLLMRN